MRVWSVQELGLTAETTCCLVSLTWNQSVDGSHFSPRPRSHSSFQTRWGSKGRGLTPRPIGRKGVLSVDQRERDSTRDRRLTAPWRQRGTQPTAWACETHSCLPPPHHPPPNTHTHTMNHFTLRHLLWLGVSYFREIKLINSSVISSWQGVCS